MPQIFHRCLEGRSQVYSFICPEKTLFDQRVLVCVWESKYDFDCSESKKYYLESNRAFLGNITAEDNMMENVEHSHEIKNISPSTLERFVISMNNKQMNKGELMESIDDSNLQDNSKSDYSSQSSSQQVQINSNDYEAELLPDSNHIDASLAVSDNSKGFMRPQKVELFIDEPIIELPSRRIGIFDEALKDHTGEFDINSRNIRKRSKNQNRFLFKADTTN